MYIQTQTGATVASEDALRAVFPEQSFPAAISDSVLAEIGFARVLIPESPAHDKSTQRVEFGSIEEIDGVWRQTWNVVDIPAEEVAPKSLTQVEFMDHAIATLGADDALVGYGRYGEVISNAEASTDFTVKTALQRYNLAQSIERDNMAVFLALLVNDAAIALSQEEADGIIGSWPDAS